MVGNVIEQRTGKPLAAEDFGPFFEGQVARDQRGRTFIALLKVSNNSSAPVSDSETKSSLSNMSNSYAARLLPEALQVPVIAGFEQLVDDVRQR